MEEQHEIDREMSAWQQRIGKEYRLIRLLGKGGYGVVYEAEYLVVGKRVAIKFLLLPPDKPPQKIQERILRFIDESKAANKIGHENIVDVLNYEEAPDGTHYLVMKLLQGEDLKQRLEREHRLTEADALSVVEQVANAMKAAHGTGIIHRDLSPSNLMMVGRHVYILDFGIAKLSLEDRIHATLTDDNSPMGKPKYMAPEQYDDSKNVTSKADVYSSGVILIEMLAGDGRAVRYPKNCSKAVQDLAFVMTEREPERRPDMAEVLDRVQQIAKDNAQRNEVKRAAKWISLGVAASVVIGVPILTHTRLINVLSQQSGPKVLPQLETTTEKATALQSNGFNTSELNTNNPGKPNTGLEGLEKRVVSLESSSKERERQAHAARAKAVQAEQERARGESIRAAQEQRDRDSAKVKAEYEAKERREKCHNRCNYAEHNCKASDCKTDNFTHQRQMCSQENGCLEWLHRCTDQCERTRRSCDASCDY